MIKINVVLFSLFTLLSTSALAGGEGQDISAKTINGESVILHANGRWEFIDPVKAKEAKTIADQYPESDTGCPKGWQSGTFGLGRCIPPGDKDYHRGSMGGK